MPDTSVWVDFLRSGDLTMTGLLGSGEALMHPFVLGEIALGHLRPRAKVLSQLDAIPKADEASLAEV